MAECNRVYGYVNVIKKDGEDGSCFPLMYRSIVGSGVNCDIRIHAPGVEEEHCSISPTELGRVKVKNLSTTSAVKVNGTDIKNRLVPLTHCDVISVAHRSFRFEYAPDSQYYFDKNVEEIKKLVTSCGTSDSGKVNQPFSLLEGLKKVSGASPETFSHQNFSPFSSPDGRQIAIVTPVMRVHGNVRAASSANSKKKNENVDEVRHLTDGASSVAVDFLPSHLNPVINMLGTPRRYQPLAVSLENQDLLSSSIAGSEDVTVQPTSENIKKRKSTGAAFKTVRKTPFRTRHSGPAMKIAATPRRSLAVKSCGKFGLAAHHAGSMGGNLQLSAKENNSTAVVRKTEGKTPLKTPSSGFATQLDSSAGPTKGTKQSSPRKFRKKNSFGVVGKMERKMSLKTPRSGTIKELELTASTHGSCEETVQSFMKNTQKNRSVGVVCQKERKTPRKILFSGGVKELGTSSSCGGNTEGTIETSKSTQKKKILKEVGQKKTETPLKTPRSKPVKELDVIHSHGGTNEVTIDSFSKSTQKNKSFGVVTQKERKTPLKTPPSGTMKELVMTISPQADSTEDLQRSTSKSKQKRKSVRAVSTPLRTLRSGSAKKVDLFTKSKSVLSLTPTQRSRKSNKIDALVMLTDFSDDENIRSDTIKLQSSEETPLRQMHINASDHLTNSKKKGMSFSNIETTLTKSSSLTAKKTALLANSPSRLSSSKLAKSQKLSTKKKFDYSSPIESRKRKREREEARSERAAKRLKLQGTPKSPDKKKSAALRVMCHTKFSLPGGEHGNSEKRDLGKKKIVTTKLPSTGKLVKKSMLPVRMTKLCHLSLSSASSTKKNIVLGEHKSRRTRLYSSEGPTLTDRNCESCATPGSKATNKVVETLSGTCSLEETLPSGEQLILKSEGASYVSGDISKLSNFTEVQIDRSLECKPLATRSSGRKVQTRPSVGKPKKSSFFGLGTSTPISKARLRKRSHVPDVSGNSVLVDHQTGMSGNLESHLTPLSCRRSFRNTSRSHSKSFCTVSCIDKAIDDQQSTLAIPLDGTKCLLQNSSFADLTSCDNEIGMNEHPPTPFPEQKSCEPISTPLSGRKSLRGRFSKSFSVMPEADVLLSGVDEQLGSSSPGRCIKKASSDDTVPNSSFDRLSDIHGDESSEMTEMIHKFPICRSEKSNPRISNSILPKLRFSRAASHNSVKSLHNSAPAFENCDLSVECQTSDFLIENTEIQNCNKPLRSKSQSCAISMTNVQPQPNLDESLLAEVHEMVESYTLDGGVNNSKIEVMQVRSCNSARTLSPLHSNNTLDSRCTPVNGSSMGRVKKSEKDEKSELDTSRALLANSSRRRVSKKSRASVRTKSWTSSYAMGNSDSIANSESKVAVENRSSQRGSQKHSISSLGSFILDTSFSNDSWDADADKVNSDISCDLHEHVQNLQHKNNDENIVDEIKFDQQEMSTVSVHSSFNKGIRKSQRISQSFSSKIANCSDISSDEIKITPTNNKFTTNSSEQNSIDVKAPASILKSGRKSLRSGRKSVVRFMTFPSVENKQAFDKNENEASDSFKDVQNDDPDFCTVQTVSNVPLPESASPVTPGNLNTFETRRISFKTNEIALSTSKRCRNTDGERSLQPNLSFDILESNSPDPMCIESSNVTSARTSVATNDSESNITGSCIGNETSFDFDSVKTPRLSKETLVSPLSNTAVRSSDLHSSTKSRRHFRKVPSVHLIDIGCERNNDSRSEYFEVSQGNVQQLPHTNETCSLSVYTSTADRPESHLIHDLETEMLCGALDNLKSPLISLSGLTKQEEIAKMHKSHLSYPEEVGGALVFHKQALSLSRALRSSTSESKLPADDVADDSFGAEVSPKMQKSPSNDLCDVWGLTKPMKTPKTPKSPAYDFTDAGDVKRLSRSPKTLNSPLNDLSNVKGLGRFLTTPKISNDLSDLRGIKRLKGTQKVQNSPLNDLSDVRGVRRLMNTPKTPKSPANDLTDIGGVKRLFGSPRTQNSPLNDLSNVKGLRRLMTTPKTPKSPVNDLSDLRGVKQLLGTPKVQNSPLNDLSDVRGLRRLMTTPKTPKSPVNDLSDLRGIKRLMGTPKVRNSPLNDLSDVRGLRRLMKTPKTPKSPVNDLSDLRGVKRLLGTPKVQNSPLNDLSDVKGLKRLMKTPKVPKSPANDLTDVGGVEKLFKSPKTQTSPVDVSDIKGLGELMTTPKTEKSVNYLADISSAENLFTTSILQSPFRSRKTQESQLSHGVQSMLQKSKSVQSPLCDEDDAKPLTARKHTLKTEHESSTNSVTTYHDIGSCHSLLDSVDASREGKMDTSMKISQIDNYSTSTPPARVTRNRKMVVLGGNSPSSTTVRSLRECVDMKSNISDHRLSGAKSFEAIAGINGQTENKAAVAVEEKEVSSETCLTLHNSESVTSKRATRKRQKLRETVEPEDETLSQNKKMCYSSAVGNDTVILHLSQKNIVGKENVSKMSTRRRRGRALQVQDLNASVHPDSNKSEVFVLPKETGDSGAHSTAYTHCATRLEVLSEMQTVVLPSQDIHHTKETPDRSPSSGAIKKQRATRQRGKKQAPVANVNENESVSLVSDAGLRRQTRRNKKTETECKENANIFEARRGKTNKNIELNENFAPVESNTQEIAKSDEVKINKRNKKTVSVASLVSEPFTDGNASIKPEPRVARARKNKKIEFNETLPSENHILGQESVDYPIATRKGRSNKNAKSVALVPEDASDQGNANPVGEVSNRRIKKEIEVETTVSEQPARKTRQKGKGKYQPDEASENLMSIIKPDSKTRRGKQQLDKLVKSEPLSPENVLREVQTKAIGKHVTFNEADDDPSKNQVTIRAKRKGPSNVDEKPCGKNKKKPEKVVKEASQVPTSSSPITTRSRRAR